MADKGLTEKSSIEAGKAAAPSRREGERDSLPIDLARKSAADAGRVASSPPPRSPLRRIAEDVGYSLRSWASATFTREQFVAGVKSLAWVAPLTVLIWIYAEREQLYTVPSVTVPIEVVHSDSSRVVTVLDPSDSHLLVTLRGPRGEVEAVQEEFRDRPTPVPIELERDVDTGEITIRAERVGMDRRFAARGVTVSNSQPGTLRVRVDTLVDQEVEVRPRFELPPGYQVKFVPPTVKVRLPHPLVGPAMVEETLYPRVELSSKHPDVVEAQNTGKTSVTIKNLPLTLAIRNKHARLTEVTSVTAEVSFKAQAERILPFVTVWPASPKEVTDKYVFEHQQTFTGVAVVGPEDQLNTLMDPAKPLLAHFWVSRDDALDALGRGELGKTVPLHFNFPPGVTVKRGPNDPPLTITYKVKPRGT